MSAGSENTETLAALIDQVRGWVDAKPNEPGAYEVRSWLIQLRMGVDALVARLQQTEQERDLAREFAAEKQTSLVRQWREAAEAAEARAEAAEKALREAQAIQPKRLAWFRDQGIVFDKAPFHEQPDEADRWQDIAFWIYTDLCEIESLARAYFAAQEKP